MFLAFSFKPVLYEAIERGQQGPKKKISKEDSSLRERESSALFTTYGHPENIRLLGSPGDYGVK